MNTLIAFTLLSITLAYLVWLFFPSRSLNRRGARSAVWAERIAWGTLLAAGASVALWMANGRAPSTWGLGFESFLGIRFDALSTPLLVLVCFLAAIILRFSRNYMAGDPRKGEFVKWICATLGCVLALILAPGLIQFAAAWIGTSLSLHRLLVYFPNRPGTLFSARKKFLLSRIADIAVIAAFVGLYQTIGSQNFSAIFAQMSAESERLLWIGSLIALAAVLKSAQFPFHTWLPDTMGTPTPVSALMHAGIINAGGVLLIRFAPVFVAAPGPLYAVAVVGALTAVFASFVMLSQTSVKRGLAYSTIAQMGFMLMQCGLGAFHLALLHILAHSLYKAHSFLSSGSTVHTIDTLSTDSKAKHEVHLPLFAAVAISFIIVFGLAWAFGINPSQKPGMIALGVVVAMATTQLLLRQLRRDVSPACILRVTAVAFSVATVYLVLASLAAWWMEPSLTPAPLTSKGFELTVAGIMFLALATTLQLQIGSRILIPLRLRDALYVHALNGFYINILANRILKLVKLQPKRA
ncbi:proton-conducting transporter membrane subunit [Pelagicoccus enzymogenes]|uniref:proton-conducting transporter transmembrane domain-containing protein n=1 Tax=Pelagicoccus enzymogenes TaxID=2773457 RepID=UPI00280FEC0C|nr:proton-conducting transporter membrane subunit [Pelagicoccus enzymogenes]MDQ8198675.1 proton-conducting transporter membrane subunit [Pelagicoccus enzymogenes]